MKKILFMLMSVLLIFSCNPPKDFIKQAKEDYAVAKSEIDTVRFYEVQIILDKPVKEVNDQKNIISTRTVIQRPDCKVKFVDREYNHGKPYQEEVEFTDGFWLEDIAIELDSVKLSFNDAVRRLKETNTILPESNKAVFRCPFAPPFRTEYIFGSFNTFFVSVDAISGEVTTIDSFTSVSGLE